MTSPDLTSVKPHLLRAWLGWCAANRMTPLLTVEPLPYVGLPATVLSTAANHQPGQPLIFNLNRQAAANLGFTGQSVFFTTLFPGQRQPSTVEIPCQNWKILRIPEVGQRISFQFPEHLPGERRPDSKPWPHGTGGVLMPAVMPNQSIGAPPGPASGAVGENDSVIPGLVWSSSKDKRST